MSAWEQVTWTVARAGGFTAYILVAISVALGLMLSMRWQSASRWPRFVNSELHNFATLLGLVFVVVHIIAVWVDPFTRFGWAEVFIPFVSHYRALWMAFGIVALYLGVAVALSTLIRPRIGYTWWRRIHLLTLVLFVLVTVHGIATGSDTRTWWGLMIYLGAVVLVGGLLCVRLLAPAAPEGRAHPGIAVACALVVLVGAGWAAAGPLHAGWNAVANNGQGSGARVALASSIGGTSANTGSGTNGANGASGANGSNGSSSTTISSAFTDTITGTLTQSNGNEDDTTITISLQASGDLPGTATLSLQGQDSDDGAIDLTSTDMKFQPASGGTYTGALQAIDAERSRWRISAVLTNSSGGQAIQVVLAVRVGDGSTVTGRLEGTPSNGSSSQSPQTPQTPQSPQSPSNGDGSF